MLRKLDYVRKSESILAYINQQSVNVRAGTPDDLLPLIKNVHLLFPQWVAMTCTVHHPQLNYISDNAETVFGYGAQYISKHLQREQFFSQLPDNDAQELYKCYSYLEEFLKKYEETEIQKLRLVFHYRFRHREGHYIHLHDEKATLVTDEGVQLYYSLYRDLGIETHFAGTRLEIFKMDQSLERIAQYQPSSEKSLTPRESELIRLIRNGLTTKQIAHHLQISHHTVRNIRSRMFEKYQVNSAIELLNRAG